FDQECGQLIMEFRLVTRERGQRRRALIRRQVRQAMEPVLDALEAFRIAHEYCSMPAVPRRLESPCLSLRNRVASQRLAKRQSRSTVESESSISSAISVFSAPQNTRSRRCPP